MTRCCPQHNCLEELSADHQKILRKLEELEVVAGKPKIDKSKIEEFLEFTENFAEPHHQKEEKVLFPALEEKGIPKDGGPIGIMLLEHKTKRGYVKNLQKALADNNEEGIRKYAQSIVSLLTDHIYKEENILYPCAKDVLTSEELANLGYQCEKIRKDETRN
jgi:hemerythrin-like domain-containing protein